MSREVDVQVVPARPAAVVTFSVTEGEMGAMGERMGTAFQRVLEALASAGTSPTGPALAHYEPTPEGFEVAAGFWVAAPLPDLGDDVTNLEVPETEVAHTTHVGPYDDLPSTYDALRVAVERTGRRLADGPMWEEYVTGPDMPPEQTRTEVYWPLAPAC